jgi:hypothetical protein
MASVSSKGWCSLSGYCFGVVGGLLPVGFMSSSALPGLKMPTECPRGGIYVIVMYALHLVLHALQ